MKIQSEKNGQFYFRGKGDNGEIILQSEGYTTKESAEKTIEVIKKEAASAEIIEK